MRNIYIVDATQVVTSAQNPQGVRSNVTDYPKSFDSRTYNDNEETALIVAQAEFADVIKNLTVAANPNRVMWAVTLTQANGVQIARKSWGAFPNATPEPEPEEA